MRSSSLVLGTLDVLILKIVALETQYGYAVAAHLKRLSGGVLHVNQGSLYPALQRLERRGWIESQWRSRQGHRRAKYYVLTHSGARALKREAAHWTQLSNAVSRILRWTQPRR